MWEPIHTVFIWSVSLTLLLRWTFFQGREHHNLCSVYGGHNRNLINWYVCQLGRKCCICFFVSWPFYAPYLAEISRLDVVLYLTLLHPVLIEMLLEKGFRVPTRHLSHPRHYLSHRHHACASAWFLSVYSRFCSSCCYWNVKKYCSSESLLRLVDV